VEEGKHYNLCKKKHEGGEKKEEKNPLMSTSTNGKPQTWKKFKILEKPLEAQSIFDKLRTCCLEIGEELTKELKDSKELKKLKEEPKSSEVTTVMIMDLRQKFPGAFLNRMTTTYPANHLKNLRLLVRSKQSIKQRFRELDLFFLRNKSV